MLVAAAARTLRASADELKQETDKISQQHQVAGRELAEHAQTFSEFIDQQRKNRGKVIDRPQCSAALQCGTA